MKYDLLVHVDLPDETRMGMALTNITNYNIALKGQDYTVVVLANSGAAQFMKHTNNPHAGSMAELNAAGVSFRVCQNAMNKAGITKEDLLDFVHIVPAGIVEIVDRQRDGFAYIKP